MDISALNRQVKASDLSIEKLANSNQVSEDAKVGEVARQFEAVLLRQIFGQAQKTVFTSKINPESVPTGIYKDMVTAQLVDRVSESGGVGLARSLHRELSREVRSSTHAAPSPVNGGNNQV